MPNKDKDNSSRKETSGQKRKAQDKPKSRPHHIEVNVVENGTKIVTSPTDGGYTVNSPCNCHAGGFTLLSGNLANAISEAFKSFKANLKISVNEEQQEEELLNSVHEDEPPTKKKREEEKENGQSIDLHASVGQLLGRSNTTSNKGKSKVLSSLKQDMQKDETGPNVDSELASIINTLIKDGLPHEKLQDKMNKYHRPGNCKNLTNVNQAVGDNLSPSVRLQDVQMQKVQMFLFKGMCALTSMINKHINLVSGWKRYT